MPYSFFKEKAMTQFDICKAYKLNKKLLDKLSEKGLIEAVGKTCPLSDNDVKILGDVVYLREAGFDDEQIQQFFSFGQCGRECLLRQHREKLLGELHCCQKKLDKTDCLIYSVNNKKCCYPFDE